MEDYSQLTLSVIVSNKFNKDSRIKRCEFLKNQIYSIFEAAL